MLAAALIGMIPAGREQAPAREILATVLAGIMLVLIWKNGPLGGTAMTETVKTLRPRKITGSLNLVDYAYWPTQSPGRDSIGAGSHCRFNVTACRL